MANSMFVTRGKMFATAVNQLLEKEFCVMIGRGRHAMNAHINQPDFPHSSLALRFI